MLLIMCFQTTNFDTESDIEQQGLLESACRELTDNLNKAR